MSPVLNFNAGPAMLPPPVLEQVQAELRDYRGRGMSIMEMSHRSKEFEAVNARAEGLADKPSFRTPLRRQRCLVPASGFYEWQKADAVKTPYYVHLTSGELFGFAGLWDRWHDPQGQEIQTYTIVTTAPNELVAPIHNRMPVILPRDAEEAWLDPHNHDPDFLTALLRPYPAEQLEAYPVSSAVNSIANSDERLIARLSAAP